MGSSTELVLGDYLTTEKDRSIQTATSGDSITDSVQLQRSQLSSLSTTSVDNGEKSVSSLSSNSNGPNGDVSS